MTTEPKITRGVMTMMTTIEDGEDLKVPEGEDREALEKGVVVTKDRDQEIFLGVQTSTDL